MNLVMEMGGQGSGMRPAKQDWMPLDYVMGRGVVGWSQLPAIKSNGVRMAKKYLRSLGKNGYKLCVTPFAEFFGKRGLMSPKTIEQGQLVQ
jgi:hypothetical protein